MPVQHGGNQSLRFWVVTLWSGEVVKNDDSDREAVSFEGPFVDWWLAHPSKLDASPDGDSGICAKVPHSLRDVS
jgi:hypothetical protein